MSWKLKSFSLATGLKDFHRNWSVRHSSFVASDGIYFKNYIGVDFCLGIWIAFFITRISLYPGSVPYIYCNFDGAEEYRSLNLGLRYIEVLFDTLYCNFVRVEEYRSSYRGFCCIRVLFHTFFVTLTGLKNIGLYTEDFVISRFYSIHFTVPLSGLKNIARWIEGFVV